MNTPPIETPSEALEAAIAAAEYADVPSTGDVIADHYPVNAEQLRGCIVAAIRALSTRIAPAAPTSAPDTAELREAQKESILERLRGVHYRKSAEYVEACSIIDAVRYLHADLTRENAALRATIASQAERLAADGWQDIAAVEGGEVVKALTDEMQRKLSRVHPTNRTSNIEITIKITRTMREFGIILAALAPPVSTDSEGEGM